MKFRDEGNCDCAFDFVYYEDGERVRNSKAEKDFNNMLRYAADSLNLEYISDGEAYRISEGQEQYLRGAADGYCFSVNRCSSNGHCFASLHVLC